MSSTKAQSSIDFTAIAKEWLQKFASSVTAGDVDGVVALFLQHGWYRDLITLTFDIRALDGPQKIKEYMSNTLAKAQITNIELDTRLYLGPELFEAGPGVKGVQGAFTFETPKALGRGNFRLLPEGNGGDWKALTVMTMISDWKGHEEQQYDSGHYDGHTQPYEKVKEKRRAEVESDPQVVIVGGGQTGLQIAARFHQMNIRALVVEKSDRLGSSWRNRYSLLSLHTPPRTTELLYQPYPSNWPFYTPKDKMADWIEQYAESQDLVVWTSSFVEPTPAYDENSKRWNLVVNKAGKQIKLNPDHLVMAVSFLGDPIMPAVPGLDTFRGEHLHGCQYKDGYAYKGKKVIVVGAGNTAADICQELVYREAASVTMLQRSPSGIVSLKQSASMIKNIFPHDVPVEISDFKGAGMPLGLTRRLMHMMKPAIKEFDKELIDGLQKAGFEVADGPGALLMVFDRGGGYFIDVGCGALIAEGKVKVKSRAHLSRVTPDSMILEDGTEIPADVIIFATGYSSARDNLRSLFGNETIDKTEQLWGTNEESELRAGFKPSGQPGLWFAVGPARFPSKLLALHIKALELGYTSF